MFTPAFSSKTRPLLFAHRGASLSAKENTFAAFDLAVQIGVDVLEMDVHLSVDGEVMVIHDPTLWRTHGLANSVRETKAAELEKLGVPLFKDVLEKYQDVGLNVDIKPIDDKTVPAVMKWVKQTDRVLLTSSHTLVMQQLELFEIPLGMSKAQVKQFLKSTYFGLQLPEKFRGRSLQIPTHYKFLPIITPQVIKKAQSHQMEVHAWVINNPNEAEILIKKGVQGIMTDDPMLLKPVVKTVVNK